jgi:hypothetical protein
MTGIRVPVSVALAVACAAASLAAQSTDLQSPALGAGASVVGFRARSEVSGGRSGAAGTVLGGLATGRLGRIEVDGRYLQGVLEPRDGSSTRRELVEGELTLGYRAAPWLIAQTGPRARTYVTPTITERWLAWLVGVRVETPIIGPTVRGHVGLWRGLTLSANVGSDEGRAGRGGDAGVTVRVPGRPWWLRLAYGIDRSVVAGAGRSETVEEFTLTIGIQQR